MTKSSGRAASRLAALAGLLLLAGWLGRLGYIGWSLWQDYGDVQKLRAEGGRPEQALALLHRLRVDLGAARAEAWFLLQPLRSAGSVPAVGPALASAGPALDLAADLALAADEDAQVVVPALAGGPGGDTLAKLIQSAQTHAGGLQTAVQAAADARAARAAIPVDVPEFLAGRLAELDPYIPLVQPAAAALAALPELAGANGPRTYLLLAQNSDELRATGGFIGSVGILHFEAGQWSLKIQNSYALDAFATRPYPPPPQALHDRMGAGMWLLRDANWSPDFPTTARDAAGLYFLGQGEMVSGVAAFDEQAMADVLAAIGPLRLVNGAGTVSADTLTAFLRQSWRPETGTFDPSTRGYQADFMDGLGDALLVRLTGDPAGLDLPALVRAVAKILTEKHALIAVGEPGLARALADSGWDGALSPGRGDFLAVVDSNVGFNKVNAALQRSITYQVDLSQAGRPMAKAVISYTLTNRPGKPCQQPDPTYGQGGYVAMIEGCYWNDLRLYTPGGSVLVSDTPQPTPGSWLWNGQDSSGRALSAAGESGATVFEQFFVLPSARHTNLALQYALPPGVLSGNRYCLLVRKQAGTGSDPLTVTLSLPQGASVLQASPLPAESAGTQLTFNLTLRTDQHLCVSWTQ